MFCSSVGNSCGFSNLGYGERRRAFCGSSNRVVVVVMIVVLVTVVVRMILVIIEGILPQLQQ